MLRRALLSALLLGLLFVVTRAIGVEETVDDELEQLALSPGMDGAFSCVLHA